MYVTERKWKWKGNIIELISPLIQLDTVYTVLIDFKQTLWIWI